MLTAGALTAAVLTAVVLAAVVLALVVLMLTHWPTHPFGFAGGPSWNSTLAGSGDGPQIERITGRKSKPCAAPKTQMPKNCTCTCTCTHAHLACMLVHVAYSMRMYMYAD